MWLRAWIWLGPRVRTYIDKARARTWVRGVDKARARTWIMCG